jgi:hypothetical protein
MMIKKDSHDAPLAFQTKKARLRKALSPVMPLGIAAISSGLIFLFLSFFSGKKSAALGFSWESALIASASGLGIFVFLYVMQMITTKEALRHSDEGLSPKLGEGESYGEDRSAGDHPTEPRSRSDGSDHIE